MTIQTPLWLRTLGMDVDQHMCAVIYDVLKKRESASAATIVDEVLRTHRKIFPDVAYADDIVPHFWNIWKQKAG